MFCILVPVSETPVSVEQRRHSAARGGWRRGTRRRAGRLEVHETDSELSVTHDGASRRYHTPRPSSSPRPRPRPYPPGESGLVSRLCRIHSPTSRLVPGAIHFSVPRPAQRMFIAPPCRPVLSCSLHSVIASFGNLMASITEGD